MPKYSYFCRLCEEAYKVQMSAEEMESSVPRCPNCGEEEKQELYAVGQESGKSSCGGCCGNIHGCH